MLTALWIVSPPSHEGKNQPGGLERSDGAGEFSSGGVRPAETILTVRQLYRDVTQPDLLSGIINIKLELLMEFVFCSSSSSSCSSSWWWWWWC